MRYKLLTLHPGTGPARLLSPGVWITDELLLEHHTKLFRHEYKGLQSYTMISALVVCQCSLPCF